MKSVKPFVVLLLFLSSFFVSCSHQEGLYTTSDIISRGDWSVAYLYTGQDKTGEFSKSTLRFAGDGKLTYTSNNQNSVGSWSLIKDENGSDQLTINISGQNSVMELSNKWSVTQKSTTDISLLSSQGETKQLRIKQL